MTLAAATGDGSHSVAGPHLKGVGLCARLQGPLLLGLQGNGQLVGGLAAALQVVQHLQLRTRRLQIHRLLRADNAIMSILIAKAARQLVGGLVPAQQVVQHLQLRTRRLQSHSLCQEQADTLSSLVQLSCEPILEAAMQPVGGLANALQVVQHLQLRMPACTPVSYEQEAASVLALHGLLWCKTRQLPGSGAAKRCAAKVCKLKPC